jgi:hypothetical protein
VVECALDLEELAEAAAALLCAWLRETEITGSANRLKSASEAGIECRTEI